MEPKKTLTGKILLKRAHVFKAAGYYFIAVAAILAAFILKLTLVDKAQFARPALAYPLICGGIAVCMLSFFIYIYHSRAALIASSKTLYSVAAAIVITYVLNIYLAMADIVAMPVYLAAFLVAPISKRRDAFAANVFANFLVFFTLTIEAFAGVKTSLLELAAMFLIGITSGSVASYTISSDIKRLNYILKGFIIGTLSFMSILLFSMITDETRLEFSENIAFTAAGMYAPLVLGLMLQPALERIFNLVTNSRLVELTDHNSPLIKRLRLETPGTFNHSMAVANFAETCASAIGENPYLARACAYYHDVGKLANPTYFKENQGEVNPHDELLPEVSAEIIRSHTSEGLNLCRRYRIPDDISHVTVQHHGTLLIPVFYEKAKKLTDGFVDVAEYSYHGTTPITKVAAIIMLCDVSEAAIRALPAPDGEKVEKLLTDLINSRIQAGQFDNCDISLRDLDTIKKTIISAYGGLFHKRMQYPSGK